MIRLIFTILVALGIVGSVVSFTGQNKDWLYMWLPLGVWFFVFAPVVVWKKEREKVLGYEKIDLELIVEKDGQYIHKRGTNWILRVGIKTNGRKSVNNVYLTVKKRNGKEHAYCDAPLHPAYSLPTDTGAFTVKPDDIKFVEVCSWNLGSPEMRLHYHVNRQIILRYYDKKYEKENQYGIPKHMIPFLLSDGVPINETIMLSATGNDTQAVSKTLRINASGKNPLWEEVQ
jgi:hypothetical protein